MNICIIGTGFVGVVTAAVYASFGNKVVGLDVDERKVNKLKKGIVPFFEPDLDTMLKEQQANGNLSFTTSYKDGVSDADIILIAVGTPSGPDGQADLKYVMMASESMAPHLKKDAIVVVKSTVPPGTLPKVEEKITEHTKTPFHTASVPEFLKEGTAVYDTLHPDRVVLGATEAKVFERLEELHKPLNAPFVKISPDSAQMAKYTANSYLATRITFINQIADLCEKNGADIQDVIRAIGYDQRVGKHYWYPGFGYGGSCFPKDVKELAAYSRSVGESNNLLNKVNEVNEERVLKLMDRYGKQIGGWENLNVAVLGLSFKPNTDDMREAPSTKVIPYLLQHNATITGFDPKANWDEWAGVLFQGNPTVIETAKARFTQLPSVEEAIADADVIISLIEWPQITQHEFSSTQQKANSQKDKRWFIDARNQFDPAKMKKAGFNYIGVGR
jgi:UDPglucose 6-dehydrogenase